MKECLKRFFITACIFAGFFIVLGSVGALECDTITIGKFVLQSCIGLLLLLAGAIGVNMEGCNED